MPAATDTITPIRTTNPREALPADRILGRRWTAQELYVLAEKDRQVQRHVEYAQGRMALVSQAPPIGIAGVRSIVVETLGTIAGTYWITAALHLAHLALASPHLLTPFQHRLLVAPLEAAEELAVNNDGPRS